MLVGRYNTQGYFLHLYVTKLLNVLSQAELPDSFLFPSVHAGMLSAWHFQNYIAWNLRYLSKRKTVMEEW